MADVASTLRSWSATPASNTPSGTTTIGTGADDNLREIQAVTRKFLASTASNMASASTVDLSTADGWYVNITGTTTITALGTEGAGIHYLLRFAGALTLTYNATSLILPGAASITTAAGDMALMVSEGSGNWRCAQYTPANGYSPKNVEEMTVVCSDETTAITAGNSKVTFRMPAAMTLTAVRASLTTAQSSGAIFTVDILETGVTILSTKLTIDNTERTSTTAATAAVISDTGLADDAEMTVNVTQVGNGTASGLKITLIGKRV